MSEVSSRQPLAEEESKVFAKAKKADIVRRLPHVFRDSTYSLAASWGSLGFSSAWLNAIAPAGTAVEAITSFAEVSGVAATALAITAMSRHMLNRRRLEQATTLHDQIDQLVPDQRFELYSSRVKVKRELHARWYPPEVSESTSTLNQLKQFVASTEKHVDAYILPETLCAKSDCGVTLNENDVLDSSGSSKELKEPKALRRIPTADIPALLDSLSRGTSIDRLTFVKDWLQANQPHGYLNTLLTLYIQKPDNQQLRRSVLQACRQQLERQLDDTVVSRDEEGFKHKSTWHGTIVGEQTAWVSQDGKFAQRGNVLDELDIDDTMLDAFFAGNQDTVLSHPMLPIAALYHQLTGAVLTTSKETPLQQELLRAFRAKYEKTESKPGHAFSFHLNPLKFSAASMSMAIGMLGGNAAAVGYFLSEAALAKSSHSLSQPLTAIDHAGVSMHQTNSEMVRHAAMAMGVNLGITLDRAQLKTQTGGLSLFQTGELGFGAGQGNQPLFQITGQYQMQPDGYWSDIANQKYCGQWFDSPSHHDIKPTILSAAELAGMPHLSVTSAPQTMPENNFFIPIKHGTMPVNISLTDAETNRPLSLLLNTDGVISYQGTINESLGPTRKVNLSYSLITAPEQPTQSYRLGLDCPDPHATGPNIDYDPAGEARTQAELVDTFNQIDPNIAKITDFNQLKTYIQRRFQYSLQPFDPKITEQLDRLKKSPQVAQLEQQIAKLTVEGPYQADRAKCDTGNTVFALALMSKGIRGLTAVTGYINGASGRPDILASSERHFYLMDENGAIVDATPTQGLTAQDAAYFKESFPDVDTPVSAQERTRRQAEALRVASEGAAVAAGIGAAAFVYRRRRRILGSLYEARLERQGLEKADRAKAAIDHALYAPAGTPMPTNQRYSNETIRELAVTIPGNVKDIRVKLRQLPLDADTHRTADLLLKYRRNSLPVAKS